MQTRQVLLSRAIQLAKSTTNLGWVPDLLQEIGAKYEFAVVPTAAEVFRVDSNKPEPNKAVFRHGRLDNNVIDTLTIHADGFVVDTTTSTDNADLFITDFLQWAMARVPSLKEVGKPFYLSQLEVSMDFGRLATVLAPIGQTIFEMLKRYEVPGVGPYALNHLRLVQDPLGKIGPNLSAFGIERRLGVPFTDDVFFVQAPLRTQDHILMLETLEQLLAGI